MAPSRDSSSWVMKSIITSFHGLSASSVNYRLPYFACRNALFRWHKPHFLIYSVTRNLISGKANFCRIRVIVFAMPGCPYIGSSW